MLAFLYHVVRAPSVPKSRIYEEFFQSPFVKRFCEQEGIEEATLEASKRRCPFLLNILAACDIVSCSNSTVTIKKLLVIPALVRGDRREDPVKTASRIEKLREAWPTSADKMPDEDLSILRELFGAQLLTPEYHLSELDIYKS